MLKPIFCAVLVSAFLLGGCSVAGERGIADKRSEFTKFLPMKSDPAHEGLKPVRPFFKSANRAEILRAIERACTGGRAGASVEDARAGSGYYVNCNPENRQLLNGYLPLNPRREPHSR